MTKPKEVFMNKKSHLSKAEKQTITDAIAILEKLMTPETDKFESKLVRIAHEAMTLIRKGFKYERL